MPHRAGNYLLVLAGPYSRAKQVINICFYKKQHSVVSTVSRKTLRNIRLRCLLAGLSPRRPGFDSRSVHVGILGKKSGTVTSFSPSNSMFRCQYHSTNIPFSVA